MVGVRDRQPGIHPRPPQSVVPMEKHSVRDLSVLICLWRCATIRVIVGDWLGDWVAKIERAEGEDGWSGGLSRRRWPLPLRIADTHPDLGVPVLLARRSP
jgi:hypothetical protein